ncbi:TIGR04222 domain-containing membrane protein [Kitasatospora sp. NPDC101183]|uniref:TIGR04222 domain-containing membrane protein n=1 Tax=Kitasatospora sp. NPDC101183 TaxID=3364100 RepID=UPI0038025DD8
MWHDTYYLIPAAMLLAAGVHVLLARRRALRVDNPLGLPGRGLPLLSAAFLAGGPGRVFDTVLVRMHQAERLVVSRDGTVTLTRDRPYDAVEQALMDAAGPSRSRSLAGLRADVMRSAAVQALGDELAARGLMRRPDLIAALGRARRWLWAAMAAVVACAVLSFLVDDHRPGYDRPGIETPAVLLFVGLGFLLTSRTDRARITPAGRRQIALMDPGRAWTPSQGLYPAAAGGALLGAIALGGIVAAGTELGDEGLQQSMLDAAAQQQAAAKAAGFSSSNSANSANSGNSGSSCSSSSGCNASSTWCGGSSDGGSSSSSCGSSSSSCGSSSSSCGSSSSSCGSSSSSCGSSSSSCGSSCGGGCGS